MTQREHQFKVGDRVRLISPIADVTVGTIGTVVYRFLGCSLYDVRFEGQTALRVVEEAKLAPAPPRSRRRST